MSDYFRDEYHCKTMRVHLQSIVDVFFRDIVPAVKNDDDGPLVYHGKGIVSAWAETEFQSYLVNLETCMHLQLVCHLWEQQVIQTFWYELGNYGYFEENGKKIEYIDFKIFEDALTSLGFDVSLIKCWEKIQLVREIVNVIKHGEGRASKVIRNKMPGFFGHNSNEDFDIISFAKVSITDEMLNINPDNFKDYAQCFLSFWDEVPSSYIG